MMVGFSDNVLKELKDRGATEALFQQLARAISDIPRKPGLAVDSSDNMISVYNLPISFIRNHKTDNAWVMTNEEARNLDRLTL